MGWSLGSVDSASAFGTAVATRVVKFRTAVTIIAIMVIAGAFIGGANNIGKLSELAASNEVLASEEDIVAAIESQSVNAIRLKSALKAAIIFACAALTVTIMSSLNLPVSAMQALTGAIIGWGLCYADYTNPAVLGTNLPQIGKFALTWILNPLGAGTISFVLVSVVNRFLERWLSSLDAYDKIIKFGYLGAGVFASYSIGVNSSASVTALYFDSFYEKTGVAANLLTDARLTATIGGIAIAIGAITYSKKIMMTVGSGIAEITQMDGFVVVISMAFAVLLMGNLLGIPVSNSQAIVGAVMGAGLTRGVKAVNFNKFKRIAVAWVSSPTAAALLTFIVGLCFKWYFG
jgi:PiT family inorganic phosphate transporter